MREKWGHLDRFDKKIMVKSNAIFYCTDLFDFAIFPFTLLTRVQ